MKGFVANANVSAAAGTNAPENGRYNYSYPDSRQGSSISLALRCSIFKIVYSTGMVWLVEHSSSYPLHYVLYRMGDGGEGHYRINLVYEICGGGVF